MKNHNNPRQTKTDPWELESDPWQLEEPFDLAASSKGFLERQEFTYFTNIYVGASNKGTPESMRN